MFDPIKPSQLSEEQLQSADLTPNSRVVECGGIRAVIRQCVEVDPVFYGDASDSKKAMFIWGLEQMLRAMGYTEYYFNVLDTPDMERYRQIVEKFGAVKISTGPEFRYKKAL